MAEELVLTDPIVVPEEVTEKYKVARLELDLKAPNPDGTTGLVRIFLLDNLDKPFQHQYTGETAINYIKFINTANFSNTSLQKRILQRLSAEGVLPGTVVGAPD